MQEMELSDLEKFRRIRATAHFKTKIFLRSSGTEDVRESTIVREDPANVEIDGSSSEFYKEIISAPSAPAIQSRRKRARSTNKQSVTKNSSKKLVKFDKEKLFRLAMSNNLDELQRLVESSRDVDVNATDAFGWTALMMAACENSCDVFRALLDLGADLTVEDRKGNTAKSLSEKKHFVRILEIIEEKLNSQMEEEDQDETHNNSNEPEELKLCPDCGVEFKKSSSRSHHASTVHLFSCKYDTKSKIQTFGISQSNRGYQIMKRTGWDGSSGLGSSGSGKLHPIKTTLRQPKSGLGIKQTPAKVTHFKPNDLNAIKFRPPARPLTRKEIVEQSLRDKRKDQRLRQELS